MRRALPGLAVWEGVVLFAFPYGPGTAGLAAGGLAGALIFWISTRRWRGRTSHERCAEHHGGPGADHGAPRQ